MRRLYHFPTSPFSRRARLAIAHKALPCELVDARKDPADMEAMRRLSPLRTAPVLVEEDGGVIGDSTLIAVYLDRAYPSSPLFPAAKAGARLPGEVASLVDGALNGIIDVGTRYYGLRDHAAWRGVVGERLARSQGALDALGPLATRIGGDWSATHIWLYTAVAGLEGLPGRAAGNANVAQIMTLGWKLPPTLSRWADAYRGRPDVRSLDA
jgi:glutathione S-transferase